jgi:hypothetical protein
VFGFEAYSIKKLDIDFRLIGKESASVIALVASTTLFSLGLEFHSEEEETECYEVLEIFFARCIGIRSLTLSR